MNEYHFDVDITPTGRRVSMSPDDADRKVWNSAADVLSDRAYRTRDGAIRVRMTWPPYSEQPSIRTTLQVIDDGGRMDLHDAPSYVELFFHDVFLLFNLAVPGSFGGVIAPSGAHHVDEVALDARLFEYALGGERDRVHIGLVPLRNVVAWYDALDLGTRQVATYGIAKVLFHLLNLSRGTENVAHSVFALAQSIEILGVTRSVDPELFRLRDSLVHGNAPVIHPLHDDVLEPEVEAVMLDWLNAADDAAGAVIAELQARILRI